MRSDQQTGKSHLGCGYAEAGRQETAQGGGVNETCLEAVYMGIKHPGKPAGKPAVAPIEATWNFLLCGSSGAACREVLYLWPEPHGSHSLRCQGKLLMGGGCQTWM